MRHYPQLPAHRIRAILGDLVVLVLVVFFAWLGLTVNDTFDEIASLGRGVEDAGNRVRGGFEDAGGLLADVPIVGGDLDDAFALPTPAYGHPRSPVPRLPSSRRGATPTASGGTSSAS